VPIEDSLSADELALTVDVISAVGTGDFYDRVLLLLDERIQCERRLVMKYSRFSIPEILLNFSLDSFAVDAYMSGLYRLDPLLRLIANDTIRPVVTFQEIRLVDHENAFYDEIFRAGLIYDELAISLPTVGGAYVALCFDRNSTAFGSHETNWARLLYPMLRKTHDLHVHTAMINGLNSLFGRDKVGILTITDDDKIAYRNDSWARLSKDVADEEIIAMTLACQERSPIEIGTRVGHWEYLQPRGALTTYRAIFLEERSAGYIDQDIKVALSDFNTVFQLSPRETQILEKMMRGYPTGYISSKLGISAGTVKNYKRRMYEKLDVKSEREIFSLFLNHLFGMVDASALLPGTRSKVTPMVTDQIPIAESSNQP